MISFLLSHLHSLSFLLSLRASQVNKGNLRFVSLATFVVDALDHYCENDMRARRLLIHLGSVDFTIPNASLEDSHGCVQSVNGHSSNVFNEGGALVFSNF